MKSTAVLRPLSPIVSQGDRLPGAPWSFMAAAEKTFHEWKGRNPYVRADFQYTTRQPALLPGQDDRNALNDTTLPGLPVTQTCNSGPAYVGTATTSRSSPTTCSTNIPSCSSRATSPTTPPTTSTSAAASAPGL